MITAVTRRWRQGRTSYLPRREVIRPAEFEVAPLTDDGEAKQFIISHHYSRSYPAARRRFGLYRRGQLVGCAVYSRPTHTRVLTNVFDMEPVLLVELGRLVLLNEVEADGESRFAARCFDHLRREGMVGVVSFSDPVPRTTATGEAVAPGHVGFVYQALSACYLGRSAPRTLRLLPDGRVMHERAIQKIRGGERGWRYAARPLEEFGAPPAPDGDKTAWLGYWLERLTSRMPHGGNHKYAWALDRAARRLLPDSRPYPKVTVPQLKLWQNPANTRKEMGERTGGLDEYRQEEVVGGLLDLGRDTQAELFWQLRSQEELYEEGPLEDLGLYLSRGLAVFKFEARGRRVYVHAKPFIWKPRIVLTVAPSEEETEVTSDDESTASREIGRVIGSDVADYERFYLGMAQAYYCPEDHALVIWECDVFHLTKHTEEDLGDGTFFVTLWRRLESMLRERFPATRLIVTPGRDPGYSSEEWRAFLRRLGYRPDPEHGRTFGKLLDPEQL